jgi:chaperonin cofactor prefoldin
VVTFHVHLEECADVPDTRVDRLEATLERLAEAQAQTQAELRALVEAQRRTEERLEKLTARVDALAAQIEQLAQAQRRTEERLEILAARMDTLAASVQQLVDVQRRTGLRVDSLTGALLEIRYRERCFAYFARIMRRIRLLSGEELDQLFEEAVAKGNLSEAEADDIREADVIARGLRREDGAPAYLVAEVSATVGLEDVERAARRAAILARATATQVAPVVAGEAIPAPVDSMAVQYSVWRVVDGRTLPPEQPAA